MPRSFSAAHIKLMSLALISMPLAGCGGTSPSGPATPPPPPPPSSNAVNPAGVWTFAIVVTKATGACAGEEGQSSAFPITITKTGTAAPFNVTASGFLGAASNTLTGTFDANNRLLLNSGSYPEDGGTTTPVHDLTATSNNQMSGIETWNWVDSSGSCPNSTSSVTATRIGS